jgi:hypothetical protein
LTRVVCEELGGEEESRRRQERQKEAHAKGEEINRNRIKE